MAVQDLPLPPKDETAEPEVNNDPALSLIRQKLDNLYGEEPAAKEEEQEIEAIGPTSKHQRFIDQLMSSGRSLADIQIAWHKYYQDLPDQEKHEVWQEFYANHARSSKYFSNLKKQQLTTHTSKAHPSHQPARPVFGHIETAEPTNNEKLPTVASIKDHLLKTVTARGKLKKRHHIQSLVFGLMLGILVIFIFMFGFFNERFIAPFITPSRNISNTAIIVDPLVGNSVDPEPKVIIPKINVEVPVIYDVTSIDEKAIENGLERGVVHYGLSPVPGQDGNVVIVGHSAQNIFTPGKYKYVFSLLHDLQINDTFMLNYYGQQYVYRVYVKKVVKPTDVSVLGPADKTATATLITCDPPGLSSNRMIIIGEQISPAPTGNIAANTTKSTQQPSIVPGNPESLFHRLFSWIWD
ncbi:MAG TPA: sortase [Patescibacteria group bacterium]|nr:sortase [Patescibacteria group bacterium]